MDMSNSLLQWALGRGFEFPIGFVPGLLSTAQARTQYPLVSFRCDDVTRSSGNCKADGFYADPQH
jgi:hypothetical protein